MKEFQNPWNIPFQHEKDQEAISSVLSGSVMENIYETLEKVQVDDIYRMAYSMSCIKVKEDNSPLIMEMLKKAASTFGLDEVPELYIVKEYEKNLELIGMNHPFLVISSRYLELLLKEKEELLYAVLASRVAGIRLKHHRAELLLQMISNGIQVLNIPKAAFMGISIALNQWSKNRYFTYDRVMYLLTENLGLCRRNLMLHILPGDILDQMHLEVDENGYQKQMESFWGDSMTENLFHQANSMRYDTLWIPERYRELDKLEEVFSGKEEKKDDGLSS